jgi:NAD(P)-dependent dehydrogenase (short-subunit alcohol dehydrogenase family)
MTLPFQNRRALVTGGTGGLGGAIARGLADLGCHVTCTGSTEAEVAHFDAGDRSVTAVPLDITRDESIQRLMSEFDRLDILVNAAGIILRDQQEFEIGNFQRVVDVNLIGTMRACVACRSHLAATQGCVINLASMLSFFGSGYVPGYSASKGGVAQLTKSLAIAWAKQGIRVNAIAPGWIETEMTAALSRNSDRSNEIVARTPLGRWGQPSDVVGAVNFLC